MKRTKYDFIICGAGCAGLSLLLRLLERDEFRDKHFLLLEKEPKQQNDRTWCFWEQQPGFFEEIVFKRWDALDFYADESALRLSIAPYAYKMIRGLDFYEHCFNKIRIHSNVEIVYAEIRNIEAGKENIRLQLDEQEYILGAGIVFNSLYPVTVNKTAMKLLQHFRGRVIETGEAVFDPGCATFMDFRVHQEHGTSFVYVLPFNERKALLEYTLFTRSLLTNEQYERELDDYIANIPGLKNYRVTEVESGVIPMTDQRFEFYQDGMYHIGAAGGQTKASTGYTFKFIQDQSTRIVDTLVAGKPLENIPGTPARFRFYDNTLLRILYHNRYPGKRIFTSLFRKNNAAQVLKFLDNESSFMEELKILASLPPVPFIRSALG